MAAFPHFHAVVLVCAAIAVASVGARADEPAVGAEIAAAGAVNFAANDAVLELRNDLSPYLSAPDEEDEGLAWFLLSVANESIRPASRIFLAEQNPGAGLSLVPPAARSSIRQIAASDPGVTVERTRTYGRYAYRVTLPAATSATLALQMADADAAPSVNAWMEPALVTHARNLAVLNAVVAGLIGSSAAIAAASGFIAQRRAALLAGAFLAFVLLGRLTAARLFDGGWFTDPAGPYALTACWNALALAVAIRLISILVPVERLFVGATPWPSRASMVLALMALLAFVGVPGIALAVNVLVVVGAGAITGYLVNRGRADDHVARSLAPAATVFALVTAFGALDAFGAFAGNFVASAAIDGFGAAGAVLVCLAVAFGSSGQPRRAPIRLPIADDADRSAALRAIGAALQGVFELDFAAETVRLSREAAELAGEGSAPVTIDHATWMKRIHPDDRGTYARALSDYRAHPGTALRIELRIDRGGGRYVWLELRATMEGKGVEAERCLGLLADITQRKENESALAAGPGTVDRLTGLGNRVGLMQALDALEHNAGNASLAILDVDRFKTVHASLGDEGADAVLCEVAQRLEEAVADAAAVFRAGGDAFAVLSLSSSDPLAIGERALDVIRRPVMAAGREVFLRASVGVASGSDARDPLGLLRNADLAMIQAKRMGGGRVCVYSAELDALAPADSVSLEAALRRALEGGEIEVRYQPIMRLADMTVAGFEALLRWQHPERGLIAPNDFIAHSERSGLILAIGRYALERAAEDLAHWQRYFALTPPLFVSVNISRRQLLDEGFEVDLREVLSEHQIALGTLRLEVTESAIVADMPGAEATLLRLKELGAGIAIDDFGTGLSSLGQLKRFPVDAVKIDKSFLESRASSPEDGGNVILSSIVTLVRELGLDVVAEGVELERDAVRLKELGCEYAQGFLYGEPLPRAQVMNFIAENHRG